MNDDDTYLSPSEAAQTCNFILEKYSSPEKEIAALKTELIEYKTLYNKTLRDLAAVEEERDYLLNKDDLVIYVTQLEEQNVKINEELKMMTARERRLTLEVAELEEDEEKEAEYFKQEIEKWKRKYDDLYWGSMEDYL